MSPQCNPNISNNQYSHGALILHPAYDYLEFSTIQGTSGIITSELMPITNLDWFMKQSDLSFLHEMKGTLLHRGKESQICVASKLKINAELVQLWSKHERRKKRILTGFRGEHNMKQLMDNHDIQMHVLCV